MIGFLFAFLTAFFDSLKGLLSKKSLMEVDEYIISWSFQIFTVIFMAPAIYFTGIPEMDIGFFWVLLLKSFLTAATTLLFMKALKHSDLSLVVPLVALTPLFLLITSPILVGEFPSAIGLVGVLLGVVGVYMLKFDRKDEHPLLPFKVLFKEKGVQLMTLVAGIWSITSNLDKIGVTATSPIWWVIASSAVTAVMLFPVMLWKSNNIIGSFHGEWHWIIPISLVNALTLFFQMTALNYILVVYVISIKRISIVLGVIWGHLFFKEKEFKQRIAGSIIMFASAVLILLS